MSESKEGPFRAVPMPVRKRGFFGSLFDFLFGPEEDPKKQWCVEADIGDFAPIFVEGCKDLTEDLARRIAKEKNDAYRRGK